MQADVTLGVIIAALAPPFGAAIIILFCLLSYVSLHIRQYYCLIDTYNRMLHKNKKSIFTNALSAVLPTALAMYACTPPERHTPAHNLHYAAYPSRRFFHHHYIGLYQYSGGDEMGAKYRSVQPASELALYVLHFLQEKDADCNQFFDVFQCLASIH